jgi:hypothetical protein
MNIFHQDLIVEKVIRNLSIEDIFSLYQSGDSTLQEIIRDIFSNTKFKNQKIREFYLDCLENIIVSNPEPIIPVIQKYGYTEEFYFDIHKQLMKDLIQRNPSLLESFSEEELLDQMTLEELLEVTPVLEVSPVAYEDIDALIPEFYQQVMNTQKKLMKKYLLMVSDEEFRTMIHHLASYDPECIARKIDVLEKML